MIVAVEESDGDDVNNDVVVVTTATTEPEEEADCRYSERENSSAASSASSQYSGESRGAVVDPQSGRGGQRRTGNAGGGRGGRGRGRGGVSAFELGKSVKGARPTEILKRFERGSGNNKSYGNGSKYCTKATNSPTKLSVKKTPSSDSLLYLMDMKNQKASQAAAAADGDSNATTATAMIATSSSAPASSHHQHRRIWAHTLPGLRRAHSTSGPIHSEQPPPPTLQSTSSQTSITSSSNDFSSPSITASKTVAATTSGGGASAGLSISPSFLRKSPSSNSQLSVLPEHDASPPSCLPPLAPSSPGTPPKKLWERQYRNFLKKNATLGMLSRGGGGSSSSSSPATPTTTGLAPPLTMATSAPANSSTITLPQHLSHQRASSTSSLHPESIVRATELDGSVRGGKLFANVFRGGGNGDSKTKNDHDTGGSSFLSLSSHGRNNNRRKVKSSDELDISCKRLSNKGGSQDELDQPLRRGAERSYQYYSPGSPHHQRLLMALPQQQPQRLGKSSSSPMLVPGALVGGSKPQSAGLISGIAPSHLAAAGASDTISLPRYLPPVASTDHFRIQSALMHSSTGVDAREMAPPPPPSSVPLMVSTPAESLPTEQALPNPHHQRSFPIKNDDNPVLDLRTRAASADDLSRFMPANNYQQQDPDWMLDQTRGKNRNHVYHQRHLSGTSSISSANSASTTVTTESSSLTGLVSVPPMASSALKKAFTEFHNARDSGQDAVSSFLGDDPSACTVKSSSTSGNRVAPGGGVLLAPPHSSSLAWTQNHRVVDSTNKKNDSQVHAFHGSFPHSLNASGEAGVGRGGGIERSYLYAPNINLATNFGEINTHDSMSNEGVGTRGCGGGLSLETVHEQNVVIHKSMRMLLSINGVEHWQQGRRYLIAPAVAAACPVNVMTSLSGPQTWTATQIANLENNLLRTTSMFGTVVLGPCLICYSGSTGSVTTTNQQYSLASLVLKQNYLLEYPDDASLRGMPRAQANLQFATAAPHPDFLDALELRFYASPCAKADQRVLLIRVQQRSERDAWVHCLNRATEMDIDDLYEYDATRPLGTGQYASVYPGRRKDDSREECALKIFDKNQFWKLVVKGRERADTIVREVSVQATLTAKCGQVPSFLRLRGFFETADHVVLELELLEGTDLFQYISSKNLANQGLEEKEAAQILRDLLTSLEAMNRIGLAHRDIKPANILMCHGACVVKVCDFGMATFVGVDGQVRGRCGTPGYVAPEIFSAGVYGGYGNKVDVFSAGVTLYVMLCGYEPFYGETDAELAQANKEAKIDFPQEDWKHISADAKNLVQNMMNPDPKKRLSAKEAMDHPWFQKQLSDTVSLSRTTSLCAGEMPVDGACVIS